MKFLLQAAVTAVAVWITTLLPLELEVSGGENEWWARVLVFLGIGAIIVALNRLLRPIITMLTLPILILTLGLFSLVITWFILWLTSWITHQVDFYVTLDIGNFWQTLLAALVIAIASSIMGAIVKPRRRR